ncbi:N-formylglutamate amidohydrolase [Phaeobacter sp.]|uniref:N-formylglutamate amidohydrolase n=1 Tax=Phaeobacter sp. TaxID=1902409 RepID=UPI0025EF2970|nr:N-formylglutamate amidohydrolase [Phaeobacter sp.]
MTYSPFFLEGADRPARWVITCDHATNVVPDFVNGGDLGLPAQDMNRHIAYDIGAFGVSKHLGALLNAPVVASNFSRLVIDPNRGADDPTLLMKLYDGSIIPGNRLADAQEREARIKACYEPYHDALAGLMRRPDPILVAIHSFTPQLRGKPPRPWQIGILAPDEEPFSPFLVEQLQQEADLCVGINQPYTGYLPGDSVDRHATAAGHPNTLIELRNDLIADPADQQAWAARLAEILPKALERSGL